MLLKEALTDVSRKQETRVVLLLHPECTCWQQSNIQVYVTWRVKTLFNCVATFSPQVNNPSGCDSRINRVNASESESESIECLGARLEMLLVLSLN